MNTLHVDLAEIANRPHLALHPMTTKTPTPPLENFIGRTGMAKLKPSNLTIPVRIKMARWSYGRLEYLVTTLHDAKRQAWLRADTVTLDAENPTHG